MDKDIVLKENDLELIVSEKTLGSLTTNAKSIRDLVKEALPKYDIVNYNDDNIDQAKKDKALLNKTAKALNDKRKEIEKEFMKPFGEFKDVVTETVSLISECSSKIDDVVKRNEQIYKDNKKELIKDYYEGLNKWSIPFEKIFKTEWLNKTKKEKVIFDEIDKFLSKIDEDIESLKSFNEDIEVLQTYYLDTLNIASTIQYANKLQEQRARAKAAEEARRKAEEERKIAEEKLSMQKSEQRQQAENKASNQPISEQHSTIQERQETALNASPTLYTRAFKVTGTKEQIIALGDFMNDNGIDFDKIEL